jgi:hypothetical protein
MDYLKFDENKSISRPIMSIYELSATITSLAKAIYEDKTLQKYIKCNDQINDLVNPSNIACELLFTKKYDAYLNRYSDIVKFSELYLNPIYIEELRSYFNKQSKITKEYILQSLDLTE